MLLEPLIPMEEDYEASFHDSMTDFLQLPTLWHVKFEMFYCTDQVCRAIANGIGGESHITLLELERCMFPNGSGGGDTIRALQTNSLVSKVRLICNQHSRSMFDALSTVLSVHTSLDQVVLRTPVRGFMNTLDFERSGTWLMPLSLTLAYASRTLKSLKCNGVSPSNKMVMKALGHALRGNSSLEYLAFTLHHDGEVRNMQALQWMVAALKQLRFNASLESLKIDGVMEAGWFVSLVILTGNELGENTPFRLIKICCGTIEYRHYIEILENIKSTRTIKELYFGPSLRGNTRKCQRGQRLIAAVKKHYWLEGLDEHVVSSLPDVGMHLRLNEAGRSYLIEDAPTSAKGVEVLSKVSDDLDSLFTHLLENPLLCDIQHRDEEDILAHWSKCRQRADANKVYVGA